MLAVSGAPIQCVYPCVSQRDAASRSAPILRAIHCHLPQFMATARREAVVRSNHARPQQLAYSMAWKEALNPSSLPSVVVYNAIGPDLCTPLYSTNATHIIGVEHHPIRLEKIQHYLDHWDIVDIDPIKLPIDSNAYLPEDQRNSPTADFAQALFSRELNKRFVNGYWDVGILRTWSMERCLCIELKKMGVNPKTIQIEKIRGNIQLKFRWAYPKEPLKERTVTFINSDIGSIFDQEVDFELPIIDGYMEKAVESDPHHRHFKEYTLPRITPYIRRDGFMLIGAKHTDDMPIYTQTQHLKDAYESRYEITEIHAMYDWMMRATMRSAGTEGDPHREYGWRLFGAIKK